MDDEKLWDVGPSVRLHSHARPELGAREHRGIGALGEWDRDLEAELEVKPLSLALSLTTSCIVMGCKHEGQEDLRDSQALAQS